MVTCPLFKVEVMEWVEWSGSHSRSSGCSQSVQGRSNRMSRVKQWPEQKLTLCSRQKWWPELNEAVVTEETAVTYILFKAGVMEWAQWGSGQGRNNSHLLSVQGKGDVMSRMKQGWEQEQQLLTLCWWNKQNEAVLQWSEQKQLSLTSYQGRCDGISRITVIRVETATTYILSKAEIMKWAEWSSDKSRQRQHLPTVQGRIRVK